MTDHPCDRCAEMPAQFYREGHAVCEACSSRMDARALIQTTWQATTRRSRRTYADAFRDWEAR
jgi:hypothetical protein